MHRLISVSAFGLSNFAPTKSSSSQLTQVDLVIGREVVFVLVARFDTESFGRAAAEAQEDDRRRRFQQRRRGSNAGEEAEAGTSRLHGGREGRGTTYGRTPNGSGYSRCDSDQCRGETQVDKEPY